MNPQPLSRFARHAANATWRDVDWARERLQPFSGKAVRFEFLPMGIGAFTLRIAADGDWEEADAEQPADATIRFTPAMLPRLAGAPDQLGAALAPDSLGDPELIKALHDLHDVLPLAVEERLSAVLGPVVAHGIASAARSVAKWPAHAAERIGAGLAAYWTEESATLLGRPAFDSFRHDVADISERTDNLAVRLGARPA